MITTQQSGCFCCLALRILDRLGLIQDDIIEFGFAKFGCVSAQRAISGENQVERCVLVLLRISQTLIAVGTGVVQHTQVRREPLGFVDPIEDQTLGYHYERRLPRIAFFPSTLFLRLNTATFKKCQYLNRFAQPHVISQTTTEAKLSQELDITPSPIAGTAASFQRTIPVATLERFLRNF